MLGQQKRSELLGTHADGILSHAFSPDGLRVLTGSADQTARPSDQHDTVCTVLAGHAAAVVSAVFSPDGSRVLTGSADRTARLWSTNVGVAMPRPDRFPTIAARCRRRVSGRDLND